MCFGNSMVTHHLYLHKEKVISDNRKSNARQLLLLSKIGLSNKHRTAILGLHAYTGNDYVSSCFGNGKTNMLE